MQRQCFNNRLVFDTPVVSPLHRSTPRDQERLHLKFLSVLVSMSRKSDLERRGSVGTGLEFMRDRVAGSPCKI